jgi:ABC-2 type transport system permease protein
VIIEAQGLARTFRTRKRSVEAKSEDALAPLLNMIMVPLMLLSGIMLPMTLGPQ